jgi:hypothetical protein
MDTQMRRRNEAIRSFQSGSIRTPTGSTVESGG